MTHTLPTFPEFEAHGVGYAVPKNALRDDPEGVQLLNALGADIDHVSEVRKWVLFKGARKMYIFYQIQLHRQYMPNEEI